MRRFYRRTRVEIHTAWLLSGSTSCGLGAPGRVGDRWCAPRCRTPLGSPPLPGTSIQGSGGRRGPAPAVTLWGGWHVQLSTPSPPPYGGQAVVLHVRRRILPRVCLVREAADIQWGPRGLQERPLRELERWLPSGWRPHTSGASAPGPSSSLPERTPTAALGWSMTASSRLGASVWGVLSGRPVLVSWDGPPLALGAVA